MIKKFKRKKKFSLIAENEHDAISVIVDEKKKEVSLFIQKDKKTYGNRYRLVRIEDDK